MTTLKHSKNVHFNKLKKKSTILSAQVNNTK